MSKRIRSVLLWAIAIVVTLFSAYYQRLTGPTHPYRGKATLSGQEISYRLIRSYSGTDDAQVRIMVEDEMVKGYFRFRRHPSHDDWQEMQLERHDDHLIAFIPHQPPAGKVMYEIFLQKDRQTVSLTDKPIVIRFRSDVPAWALVPHVILMFLAMLWSLRSGFAAIFAEKTARLTLITFLLLLTGGLVLGPIVQKYAFGDFWTGWPTGSDLTDNKTALAFVFWLIALIKTHRNPHHRTWVLLASMVLLLIYLIPHSLMGSEIDWTQEDMATTLFPATNSSKALLNQTLGIF